MNGAIPVENRPPTLEVEWYHERVPTRAPATLSADDVRPLTSREIAQVLCSILDAISQIEPDEVATFSGLLDLCGPVISFENQRSDRHVCLPSWRTAFSATVAGFYKWCDPVEVETAITWIAQNLPNLFRQGRALD